MFGMGETLTVAVRLTRQQIEASPSAGEDEPVTKQLEARLYDDYVWVVLGRVAFRRRRGRHPALGAAGPRRSGEGRAEDLDAPPGDPHLGSAADIKGCAVHAADGDLGLVEHVLADDVAWDIRYLVVATHHWLRASSCSLRPRGDGHRLAAAPRQRQRDARAGEIGRPGTRFRWRIRSPTNSCAAISAGPATAREPRRRDATFAVNP